MGLAQSRSKRSKLPKYGAKSLFCFRHVFCFLEKNVNFKEENTAEDVRNS